MKKNNNRTVVNLRAVQFADFYYKSGVYKRHTKPKFPTVNNTEILPGQKCFATGDDLLTVAKRRNLLDVWIPVCRLQLSANHSLLYTGKKAVSIYKEFSRRQFSKQNNKQQLRQNELFKQSKNGES